MAAAAAREGIESGAVHQGWAPNGEGAGMAESGGARWCVLFCASQGRLGWLAEPWWGEKNSSSKNGPGSLRPAPRPGACARPQALGRHKQSLDWVGGAPPRAPEERDKHTITALTP